MKNIGASVSEVLTQEKKAIEKKATEDEEEEEEVEEEYHQMENEMIFYLNEAPEYRISAVGRWLENSKGEVVGDADTYFRHVLTGERCETAWTACLGWSDQDERTEEIWETLAMRIQNTDGLEQIICDEESFGV